MGLWDRITGQAKAQFLDVIQWLDDSNDTLVYRFPIHDQAITDNSKLTVREGQAAVFIHEGKLSEVFGPGTYTLDTRNAPIMTFFRSIAYAMETPYKGDVLFVSTRRFMDNGWGTQNPFMLRDAEFGPVRVRAFGSFSFRVMDPAVFIRQVVGTDGLFTTSEIVGQLKKRVVAKFATAVGSSRIPVLDLVASYEALGGKVREQIDPEFREGYGLTLTDLTVGNISLPPEVEKALDSRSKMGILGDLNAYTQLKSAEAIETAAANPGMAGAGVGMGVGFGMGQAVGGHMAGQMGRGGQFNPHQGMQGPPSPAPPPPPSEAPFHYHGPSGQAELTAAQVAEKVAADRTGSHQVWQAGFDGWKPWSDVPAIASKVPPAPPAPPPLGGPEPTFHHNGPSGQAERSLSEVVAAMQAAPDADHHVWQQGWDGWKPAAEVPEIAEALKGGSGGPPPPPAPGGPPPLG